MELINPRTVKELQLQAPLASSKDTAFVNNSIRSKRLFPLITNSAVQEEIRLNVLCVEGLIPTFWSYHKDTKYLEPLVNAMKILVKVRRNETLQQAFFRIYTSTNIKKGSYLWQDDKHKFVKVINN
jgi:hypothetical protein